MTCTTKGAFTGNLPSQQAFRNDCIDKFAKGCQLNVPIDAHNLGPWVELTVNGGKGEVITVSNESCSNCNPQHTAVIKSMEYGSTDALTINIVVHEQAGGTFDSLVLAMNTDSTQFNNDYELVVKWGWVGEKCGGQKFIPCESIPVTFLVTSLTASFDQGKIVYEIEGTDLWKQMMATRAFEVQGTEKDPIPIKQAEAGAGRIGRQANNTDANKQGAIRRMFASEPQPMIEPQNVRFLRRLPSGEEVPFDIVCDEKSKKIPVSYWEPANKTKIAVALDWMKPYVTDAGKGCQDFVWDVRPDGKPGIIFWEDNASCDPIECSCDRLGYYIVNGSKYSPVISFQPKFKWNFTHLGKSGGQPAPTATAKVRAGDQGDGEGVCNLGEKGTGNQLAGASADHEDFERSCGRTPTALEIARRNQTRQSNSKNPHIFPVEADLVIQGNPSLVATALMYKQWVSIIVVNPFHLTGGLVPFIGGDGECPDWTLKPPCNEMMTNKGWFVRGVNHSIKDGSYTTTLKVYLTGPGGTKRTGEPLGCNGPPIN
jgi:hypothetical protein